LITSVTSATVAATSAIASWGLALGAGGVVLVIVLLVGLELLGEGESGWRRGLQGALRLGTAPLLFVFAVSVIARAIAILH
jgi:hypothetical protein